MINGTFYYDFSIFVEDEAASSTLLVRTRVSYLLEGAGEDLMTKLPELINHHYNYWKLDGIYCPGHNFVEIVQLFVKARDMIEAGTFTQDQAFLFDEQIRKLHPAGRGLDTGFYELDPQTVK